MKYDYDEYLNNVRLEYLIFDALAIEAKNEKIRISLEFRYSHDIGFDILTEGCLKRFGNDPSIECAICIKNTLLYGDLNNQVRRIREISGFTGIIIFLFNDYIKNKNLPIVEDDNTLFFGKETIDDLFKKHPEVLINAIAGDEESRFEFIDDSNAEIVSNKESPLKNKNTTKFSSKTPESISDVNENRFSSLIRKKPELCSLILGNGVSIPFGCDSWPDMIHNMLDYLKPHFIESCEEIEKALSKSYYAISSFVKTTLINNKLEFKYYEALKYSIYRKYNDLMHQEKTLIKVVAKAKHKYKNLKIFTYNYDTFVERQYFVDYRQPLNYYCGANYPSHLIDSVIHLHGYYSYTQKNYNGIILTDEDYYSTYDTGNRTWVVCAQEDILANNVCLFIGSSMSDIFQMSLIKRVRERNKKDNWMCYALMCMDTDKIGLRGTIKLIEYYQKKGIQIIFAKSFEDLPDRLSSLLSLK